MKPHATVLSLLVVCGLLGTARAEPPSQSKQQYFATATKSLEEGAINQAIDEYELMADHGIQHPDASFNRALAYIRRAESPQEQAGDLGRAAAAFSEVLTLRPDDAEAREGLRLVREEIGRRRARRGAEQVIMSPSLARTAVGLLSETTWAILAGLGSAMLSVGLALRLWFTRASSRLTGGILGVVGALLLVVSGAFAFGARHLRLTSRAAIVVVPEARLLDETGKPRVQRGTSAIIEGERVYVVDERGPYAQIEWGTVAGWVNRSQLMLLDH